jgi:hypothetical protein
VRTGQLEWLDPQSSARCLPLPTGPQGVIVRAYDVGRRYVGQAGKRRRLLVRSSGLSAQPGDGVPATFRGAVVVEGPPGVVGRPAPRAVPVVDLVGLEHHVRVLELLMGERSPRLGQHAGDVEDLSDRTMYRHHRCDQPTQ